MRRWRATTGRCAISRGSRVLLVFPDSARELRHPVGLVWQRDTIRSAQVNLPFHLTFHGSSMIRVSNIHSLDAISSGRCAASEHLTTAHLGTVLTACQPLSLLPGRYWSYQEVPPCDVIPCHRLRRCRLTFPAVKNLCHLNKNGALSLQLYNKVYHKYFWYPLKVSCCGFTSLKISSKHPINKYDLFIVFIDT